MDCGMSPLEREMMRISQACGLSATGKIVVFVFTDEMYNTWLKVIPATSYIDTW